MHEGTLLSSIAFPLPQSSFIVGLKGSQDDEIFHLPFLKSET